MNGNAFIYIRNYLEKNYPMFSNRIMSVHNTFLPSLVDSIHAEYGLKALNQGAADEKIDKLFNQYIRDNFEDNKWNSFNELCNYIKSISVDKYYTWTDLININLLNGLVKDVALSIIDMEDDDYSKYMDGSYNQMILTNFEKHSDKFYDSCSNYIKEVLYDIDFEKGYNDSTYNYLINLVIMDMLKENNIRKINSGVLDNTIISKYMKVLKQAKLDVRKYIKELIYEREFCFTADLDNVEEFIKYEIFTIGKLNIEDLLSEKLDYYVIDYIKKNTSKKEIDVIDVKNYLYRIICNNSFGLSNQEISEMSDSIFNILYNNNCSLKDIMIGRHDKDINNILNRFMMKRNSVVTENAPKMVKHEKKKKKISPLIKTLVIISIVVYLTGSALFIPSSPFNYNVFDNLITSEELEEFEDFPYSGFIYTSYNDMAVPTAINSLDYYNKVKDLGIGNDEIYCYLGFYNAYSHISGDNILFVMDEIFDQAQIEAANNKEYSDIYINIKNYSCFLEFAMDRLEDMGCKKIKNERYVEALNAYKKAQRYSADEVPMDIIDDKNYECVKEIMNLYRQYSIKFRNKFENILSDVDDKNEVDVSTAFIQSGRKI